MPEGELAMDVLSGDYSFLLKGFKISKFTLPKSYRPNIWGTGGGSIFFLGVTILEFFVETYRDWAFKIIGGSILLILLPFLTL